MPYHRIDDLVEHLRTGRISRRAFMRKATAAGVSAATASMIANAAVAQEASPAASPSASPVAGPVTTSLTREEYNTLLFENFPMEAPGATGGQVIMPSITDIATLNPHIRADVIALYIINPIFSYLITGAPWDPSVFGPDLADYWEESADGLTYTFYLNRDARFHDGVPVTAQDVVFSYDTMIDPDGLATYQSDFAANVASYRAIDDYTFELVAKQRSALFLSTACAGLCVLPKHIWEGVPLLEWGSAPGATGQDPTKVIGSGPFKFLEWVPNDHVTVVRNDDYFIPDQVATIDSFTLRVVPEQAAALQTFLTGETDITGVAPNDVETITSSAPDATFAEYDTWQHIFFAPYQGEGATLFTDVETRQALYYALDRDLIVESIAVGYGTRADGPQPPPSPAYAPDQISTIYTYDPEKAKSLLESAGWVDTDGDGVRERDGVKLETDLYYISTPLYDQIVAYAQEAWGAIGLRVNLVSEPQPTMIERVQQGNYQLSVLAVTWTNMGDQGAIHGTAGIPPNGFNIVRWSNEEYDALQAQQLVELDPDKRREILIEMSNIFNDAAPEILLYFTKGLAASQPRVQNFYPNGNTLLNWTLQWMWIDPAAG
jgi:peptide/nickel transport system substrate-binding protein